MPAYVLAYAYTDFLQYSGPLQTALRRWTGAEGRCCRRAQLRRRGAGVRAGAVSYVYLLTRAALQERGVHLEAARLLGAGMSRRVLKVALRWRGRLWQRAWRSP